MSYILIICLLSYLVGSIPFGLVIVKFNNNLDIRNIGSGNIGAANVSRVAGKFVGFIVFLLDGAKGIFGALLLYISSKLNLVEYSELNVCLSCISAVIGHVFPIYIKFKGGKAVATSAISLLVIDFKLTLTFLTAWILVFLKTRYSSLGSIIGIFSAWLFGLAMLIFDKISKWDVLFITSCLLIIVIKHKENIVRLKNGLENKL